MNVNSIDLSPKHINQYDPLTSAKSLPKKQSFKDFFNLAQNNFNRYYVFAVCEGKEQTLYFDATHVNFHCGEEEAGAMEQAMIMKVQFYAYKCFDFKPFFEGRGDPRKIEFEEAVAKPFYKEDEDLPTWNNQKFLANANPVFVENKAFSKADMRMAAFSVATNFISPFAQSPKIKKAVKLSWLLTNQAKDNKDNEMHQLSLSMLGQGLKTLGRTNSEMSHLLIKGDKYIEEGAKDNPEIQRMRSKTKRSTKRVQE